MFYCIFINIFLKNIKFFKYFFPKMVKNAESIKNKRQFDAVAVKEKYEKGSFVKWKCDQNWRCQWHKNKEKRPNFFPQPQFISCFFWLQYAPEILFLAQCASWLFQCAKKKESCLFAQNHEFWSHWLSDCGDRQARDGTELSSSLKTRVFVPGFWSSKKFKVRAQVRKPEIF